MTLTNTEIADLLQSLIYAHSDLRDKHPIITKNFRACIDGDGSLEISLYMGTEPAREHIITTSVVKVKKLVDEGNVDNFLEDKFYEFLFG